MNNVSLHSLLPQFNGQLLISLDDFLLADATPLRIKRPDAHDLHVRRILRGELVRFGRSRLAATHQPSIIIGGLKVFVGTIDYIIEIKCNLVCKGVGVAAIRCSSEGETQKGKPIHLGLDWFEYGRLYEDGGYALREFSTVVLLTPSKSRFSFEQRGAAKRKTRSKKVFQDN